MEVSELLQLLSWVDRGRRGLILNLRARDKVIVERACRVVQDWSQLSASPACDALLHYPVAPLAILCTNDDVRPLLGASAS